MTGFWKRLDAEVAEQVRIACRAMAYARRTDEDMRERLERRFGPGDYTDAIRRGRDLVKHERRVS